MSKRFAVLAALFVVGIGVLAVVLFPSQSEHPAATADTTDVPAPALAAEPPAPRHGEVIPASSEAVSPQHAAPPRRFIWSIYDYDLDTQQKASARAEDLANALGTDSVLRWRPVMVEPEEMILGSYMDPAAAPQLIELPFFNDLRIVASMTDYQLAEEMRAAVWLGDVVEGGVGRVEITIVEYEGITQLTGRAILETESNSRVASISPTENGETYIAIEGNPHQDYSHE